jgi:Glycosyl transferases group 1
MNVLFLCLEGNAVREIAGYVNALRRRSIGVQFVPGGTAPNVDLTALIARCPERPSLIFHPDADFPIMPRGLNRVAIPTALLQADPYAYTHRRLRWAMLFDYVLLMHEGFEERFRAAGHPGPITVVHGVDAAYFEGPEPERCFEVSCVGRVDGASYRTRRDVLSALEKEFHTNKWRQKHTYQELADVYRRSKIVVNIGRDDYPRDVSLRFAETMAAGALFLTQLPSEIEGMGFEEGTHYVGFRKQEEIATAVRKYLMDEETRQRIASGGREKVLREHTYDVRVKTLFDRLMRDAAKLSAPARDWPESHVRLTYLDYFAGNGALHYAVTELPTIASGSLPKAVVGAALLGRAWEKRTRGRIRARLYERVLT